MPGAHNEQKVDDIPNGTVVLAEGQEANIWIVPQLCTMGGGKVLLKNKKDDPVFLSKNKKSVVKITLTRMVDVEKPETDVNYYSGPNKTNVYNTDEDYIAEIEFNPECDPEVRKLIDAAHAENREVFNKDLTGGYNGYFGQHDCKLNWSSSKRPKANKVGAGQLRPQPQGPHAESV